MARNVSAHKGKKDTKDIICMAGYDSPEFWRVQFGLELLYGKEDKK